jgi:hypothetical protein
LVLVLTVGRQRECSWVSLPGLRSEQTQPSMLLPPTIQLRYRCFQAPSLPPGSACTQDPRLLQVEEVPPGGPGGLPGSIASSKYLTEIRPRGLMNARHHWMMSSHAVGVFFLPRTEALPQAQEPKRWKAESAPGTTARSYHTKKSRGQMGLQDSPPLVLSGHLGIYLPTGSYLTCALFYRSAPQWP